VRSTVLGSRSEQRDRNHAPGFLLILGEEWRLVQYDAPPQLVTLITPGDPSINCILLLPDVNMPFLRYPEVVNPLWVGLHSTCRPRDEVAGPFSKYASGTDRRIPVFRPARVNRSTGIPLALPPTRPFDRR
jgi:hypothetical protein